MVASFNDVMMSMNTISLKKHNCFNKDKQMETEQTVQTTSRNNCTSCNWFIGWKFY